MNLINETRDEMKRISDYFNRPRPSVTTAASPGARVTRCPDLCGIVPHFSDFSGVPPIETLSRFLIDRLQFSQCAQNMFINTGSLPV